MSNTIDIYPTGCDYEQFQLNELENENMKLRKQLEIATKALKEINKNYHFTVAQDVVYKALKEMKGVK